MTGRALVVGLGAAGRHAVTALQRHGHDVVVVEDAPGPAHRDAARELGVDLVEAPSAAELGDVVRRVGLVCPSPAVPPSHPVFAVAEAAGVPIMGEFELAARWSDRPMVAITGTDGKTTVTTMVTEMLEASGVSALLCGNNDLPLVSAIERDADVLVVEASSFRLELTDTFRPRVGTWLNFAEDHLDWHPSVEAYAAAKARIWAAQHADDVAIANADDPIVAAAVHGAPSRQVWFGSGQGWREEDGVLVTPEGEEVVPAAELWRAMPYDVANALAAGASAVEGGATLEGVGTVLRTFGGLPHRVVPVGDAGGVRFYDDSKATAPHAVLAAVEGFDSVVLIAGGRNKGLDLSVLSGAADRVRSVVAIGEAAAEVADAFEGRRPVTVATSMDDAVRAAASAARPGDVVLLSPGCASYDWYHSYGERGLDFARAVRELIEAGA